MTRTRPRTVHRPEDIPPNAILIDAGNNVFRTAQDPNAVTRLSPDGYSEPAAQAVTFPARVLR